jgi:short-subunit dehydrogenase
MLNFSYALTEELKDKEISVTCVCPGPASTEFFKEKKKKADGLKIEDPVKIVAKALKDMNKKKKISVYGFEMNIARFLSKFVPRKYLAKVAGNIKFPK